MRRSPVFVIVAVILVTLVQLARSTHSLANASGMIMGPSSDFSDIIYSPEPAADRPFLTCAAKISFDCVAELLVSDMFPYHLEAKCCRQLLVMGKGCNDLLVTELLINFDKSKTGASIRQRSDNLWARCLLIKFKQESPVSSPTAAAHMAAVHGHVFGSSKLGWSSIGKRLGGSIVGGIIGAIFGPPPAQ